MLTDVFVRVYEDPYHPNNIRRGMAMAVLSRWALEPDIRVIVLSNFHFSTAFDIRIVEGPFHMGSKRAAERLAKSPIYVIADDDCLPVQRDFVASGLKAMSGKPDYGMMGAFNITDNNEYDFNSGAEPGGIVFVRKGILTDFEDRGPDKVDGSIADEMKRKHFRYGVSPNIRFNHLGSGYSLTSAGNWSA